MLEIGEMLQAPVRIINLAFEITFFTTQPQNKSDIKLESH